MHGKTRRNREISNPPENLASRQELVFFGVGGMRFDFHNAAVRQGEDSFEASCGLKRQKREEEVDEAVVPGQDAVDDLAIQSIQQALFSRLK